MAMYSDLNQSYIEEVKVYNLESIQQSIHNILSTPKGTRLFLPEFGSELERYLFDPMVDVTIAGIEDEIISAIERWEYRVILEDTFIVPYYNEHRYEFTIRYSVVGLSGRTFEYVGELVKE